MNKHVTWGRVEGTHKNVVIVASGPSLTNFDFSKLQAAQEKHDLYIIAVNGAIDAVPFANAWFTLDPHDLSTRIKPTRDKKWYAAVPDDFGHPKARSPRHRHPAPKEVTYLQRLVGNGALASKHGLSEDPSAINTGNSAYGALGLAYHLQARNILLLGVDGTVGYFYNPRIQSGPLGHLGALFESAKPQLDERGINVINGSPDSIVTAWERLPPGPALTKFVNMANKKDIHVVSAPKRIAQFACAFTPSDIYTPKYVNKLHEGLKRQYGSNFVLTCLTDHPGGLHPEIRVVPSRHQYPIWWGKIELFRDDIWKDGERIWYFDLDTIFTEDLRPIIDTPVPDEMMALADFHISGRLASGVMSWIQNDNSKKIYTEFVDKSERVITSIFPHGDQCWIGMMTEKWTPLQAKYPGRIYSVLIAGHRRPNNGAIGVFYGKTKPHNAAAMGHEWVKRYW